jgi:hypothetical protein
MSGSCEVSNETYFYTHEVAWGTADFTSQLISGIIVVAAYSALLMHTLRGNRNKWLIKMTIGVIINGVGYSIVGATQWLNWKSKFNPDGSETRELQFPSWYFWSLGFGFMCSLGSTNAVHYFLALKYRNILRKVPELIDKEP